jgi:soluble lytic murein transglycosylase-like protein
MLDGVRRTSSRWVLGWALAGLLGGLAGGAATVRAGRHNYYAYTDANGVLHVTNVPGRSRGDWALYKTLEGSGGDDTARGRASSREGRAPVRADSERLHRWDSFIRAAAQRYQLPEALLRAVIHTESNYYPQAVSRAGAVGLMQLMPKTAKALGVRDPFDPGQSVHGGARYLRLLANRYDGDMVLVLAGYNAGAGNVERYGGVPPFAETRAYVRSVLRRYYAYERQQQLGLEGERPGPARHIAR